MLNFADFIQVYVFSTNHHLNRCFAEANESSGTEQMHFTE